MGFSVAGKMANDASLVRTPQFRPAIIRYAVWLYVHFALGYREVDDVFRIPILTSFWSGPLGPDRREFRI
jgi:hypothetical protein